MQLGHRQTGFNLISLMIGTTLSLLSILAMLSLYKNLVANAIVATEDAQQDGQAATARLTIQRGLQSAGYGIETPTVGTDIELRSGIQLNELLTSVSNFGNLVSVPVAGLSNQASAILWRYTDASGSYCLGALSYQGGLYQLQVAGNSCTGALNSKNWSARPILATTHNLDSLGNDATRPNAVGNTPFRASYAECWPYGKNSDSTLGEHLQISFESGITLNQGGTSTICLTNFPK